MPVFAVDIVPGADQLVSAGGVALLAGVAQLVAQEGDLDRVIDPAWLSELGEIHAFGVFEGLSPRAFIRPTLGPRRSAQHDLPTQKRGRARHAASPRVDEVLFANREMRTARDTDARRADFHGIGHDTFPRPRHTEREAIGSGKTARRDINIAPRDDFPQEHSIGTLERRPGRKRSHTSTRRRVLSNAKKCHKGRQNDGRPRYIHCNLHESVAGWGRRFSELHQHCNLEARFKFSQSRARANRHCLRELF